MSQKFASKKYGFNVRYGSCRPQANLFLRIGTTQYLWGMVLLVKFGFSQKTTKLEKNLRCTCFVRTTAYLSKNVVKSYYTNFQ